MERYSFDVCHRGEQVSAKNSRRHSIFLARFGVGVENERV